MVKKLARKLLHKGLFELYQNKIKRWFEGYRKLVWFISIFQRIHSPCSRLSLFFLIILYVLDLNTVVQKTNTKNVIFSQRVY